MARLLGYSRGRWRPARRCWPMPASRSGAGRHPGRAARPGTGEHRFLRLQGSTFWGQLHASEVRPGEPEAGMV
jgi:hypothetical protein